MNPPRAPLRIRLAREAEPPGTAPEVEEDLESPETGLIACGPEEISSRESPQSPRRRPGQGWTAHPILLAGLMAISLGLLGWSLLIRLPGSTLDLPVSARTRPGLSEVTLTETPLEPAAIAELRARVKKARQYLIRSGNELVEVVSAIERLALEEGWRAEVSLKPGLPPPEGLNEALLHPATIQLSCLPGEEAAGKPAYHRLLAFLRHLEEMGKKIQLTGLHLQAGADGLRSAQADFVFWTDTSNENASPK
jgi:hypothetical protein